MNSIPARLSGVTNEYFTPPSVLREVRKVGWIAVDPATTHANPTKAGVYYTADDDGLRQTWAWRSKTPGGIVFVNPPYSGDRPGKPVMPLWCEKIAHEAKQGRPILALLPAGTRFSTKYFQNFILGHPCLTAICWIRGRLSFLTAEGHAMKANMHDSVIYCFNVFNAVKLAPLGVVQEINVIAGGSP